MTNTTRAPWTPAENLALSRIYFTMLFAAVHGQPYNKAAMIRAVQNNHSGPIDSGLNTAALKLRSRGSIEAKLMNASAAHRDLMKDGLLPDGLTMDGYGYRALANYQSVLKDAIIAEAHRLAEMRKAEGMA